MTSSVSEPLKILSSSKEAHAHGEPGSVPAQEIKLSDEKIDALTWLVEQLSNSVSETRNRQTRLAKVLEQSLMSMGQSLAASEARLEKMLDERLGHFEQMRAAEAEETGSPLSALSAQIDATREHNDRALCEFRASLEAMERTQALSEARVAEKLDESLSRLAQEQGRTPEASDETLGALSARLDVESERNENALSDLHAAMTAMERTLANSEARVEEVLDNRLSRFEQARDKISKAGDDRLKALGAKLDSESARNEEELSNLRAAVDAMERTFANPEACVEDILENRLSRFEQAKDKESQASEKMLGELAAKLEAERERNTNTHSELCASLEAMGQTIAGLEAQIEENIGERLDHLEQAQDNRGGESDEILGALSARLDVESGRNENALSDLHAAMTAMERTLANSEARVEEVLDNRLSRFEQARDKISKAGDDRLKALGAKLDSESARNEEELSNLRALLEAMERTIASSEARVEENIGERLDHLEQAQGDIAGASEDTLKALAARFEAEAEQNTHTLSNFRASLQAMEGSLAKLELQIEDAMKGGPSLYDQAKKKEAEALRGVVEDLMEQGSIRQAIEMHWNKKEP